MKYSTIACTVLTLSSLIIGSIAYAETPEEKTSATLTLKGIEESVPELIIPEDGNHPTHQTGELTIDAVPDLDFGASKISSKRTILPLLKETVSSLQVSDRRGTGDGWRLEVSLAPFINNDETVTQEEAKTLRGAELFAELLSLETSSTNTAISKAPAIVPASVIPDNESQPILTAAKGYGLGSWGGYFSNFGEEETKTTITIPEGNYQGSYTANLTWSLMDTPGD